MIVGRKGLSLASILVVGLLLGACGGDGSDDESVSETEYAAGMAAINGRVQAIAEGLLTPDVEVDPGSVIPPELREDQKTGDDFRAASRSIAAAQDAMFDLEPPPEDVAELHEDVFDELAEMKVGLEEIATQLDFLLDPVYREPGELPTGNSELQIWVDSFLTAVNDFEDEMAAFDAEGYDVSSPGAVPP